MLGLATGPVCVASCGPVVLPWMLSQPQGVAAQSRQLALFLAARLAGYLIFAAGIWAAGASIPRSWMASSWVFGSIRILLAAGLLVYAAGWRRRRCASAGRPAALVQIGVSPRPKVEGAFALGFLTGVNFCPPFLVAGVRAAQLASLPGTLLFFAFFFAGTAVWFLPFVSFGFLRRTPAVVTVARMTAALMACWYVFTGISSLIERAVYG